MAGLSVRPVNLPSNDLSFTNKIYLSQADFASMFPGAEGACYSDVKGHIFTVEGHKALEPGTIAMNKVHRTHAKIGLNQDILVKRFVPPGAFRLGGARLEVDLYAVPPDLRQPMEIKDDELEPIFRGSFHEQIFACGQPIALDYNGSLLKFVVQSVEGLDLGTGEGAPKMTMGVLSQETELNFAQGTSGKLRVHTKKAVAKNIFRQDFDFNKLQIGGLTKEFGDIFRRAFASRVYPPHILEELGISHVRGMLLYGPPGTGKTLIARKIGQFLEAAEPKVINGPEVLNKYVGASEENIRNLFKDAEEDQKKNGDLSQLHIIIFDEIDAICKSRGRSSDSTGVGDSVVNQLLSKIDGVDSLNNILLIGMTNRIDLIDEALLRPGRLEVHIEISLPNEGGRVDILNIKTANMKKAGRIDPSVNLETIAQQTKNFSGAELEGLVRSAVASAMDGKIDIKNLDFKNLDIANLKVMQDDFELALTEVKPAFGQHTDDFAQCGRHGIIPYSSEFEGIQKMCMDLVNQVRNSANTPLLTLLLSGASGSGKTALSAEIAKKSEFPFVRRVAAENFVGYSEHAKIASIGKIFDDAYKSNLSLIVLDDIERLMDYVRVGPRFSNSMLQALFAILKKQPPKSHRRLMIVCTTSDPDFLDDCELLRAFNVHQSIPDLSTAEHVRSVLNNLNGYNPAVVDQICSELKTPSVSVQKLLLVAEMALQREGPVNKEAFLDGLITAGVL